MRPTVTASLHLHRDHLHLDAVDLPRTESDGLRIEFDDRRAPVRWGRSLMAVRRQGRWSRGGDNGSCTLDLVPSGAGRTLLVLSLEQSRRRFARSVAAEECWAALSRLRDGLELGRVAPGPDPAAADRRTAADQPADLPPPRAVPSGILPA